MTPALGVLAALMTLASAAALVRVDLLPTGARPLSDALGNYGVGPYSRYYRWQTAASAYAALLVAAALARTTHPVPQLPVFLLLVFAVARLVIPTFPADLDRSYSTLTGRLHLLAAAVALASIAWCAVVLPQRVHWPSLHGTLVVLGWIVVATAVGCALALRSRFFGLVERAFSAAVLLWLLVVSLHFV